jgi:hypothetical protein
MTARRLEMASALRDNALLIASAAVGIAVAATWPHKEPAHCPQPSGASVELLFAPCLVAAELNDRPPRSPAPEMLDLAPPPAAPADEAPAVARGPRGRDVEATGSLPSR